MKKVAKKVSDPVVETISKAASATATSVVSDTASIASTGSTVYQLTNDAYEVTKRFVEGSSADAIGGCVGLDYAAW